MERLSSCYFCGDAVDASLETYPLVPDDYDRTITTGRQVVLCPTCRRKLTTAVEHVLEAAFDDQSGVEESVGVLQDVDADEPMIATGVDRSDVEESDRSDAEESDPARHGSNGDDRAASSGGATGADSGTAPDEGSEGDGPDEGSEGDGPDERSAGEGVGEAGDSGADAGRDDSTAASGVDRDQYTRTEYNRIVRLLQNREFPVEIDEIEVVARNAYGIDEATCHAVVDALVERGVLADRGEELVRG